MKYGYARISTIDQNADMQLKALRRAGVERKNIFKDELSRNGPLLSSRCQRRGSQTGDPNSKIRRPVPRAILFGADLRTKSAGLVQSAHFSYRYWAVF
jgi:hypothetical protein